MVTLRTYQSRLELSLHEIHNDALVPHQVPPPGLSGYLLVRPAVRLESLHVGLLLDTVQILMQAVQQESDEFLAVVLLEPCKLGGYFCNGLFKGPGGGGTRAPVHCFSH